jgi:hypothetical protein
VGHIGDFCSFDGQAVIQLGQAGFGLGDFILEKLAFLYSDRPGFGIEFSLHSQGVVVPFFAQLLRFPLKTDFFVVEGNHEIGVGVHVSLGDVFLHFVELVFDKFIIQHSLI